MTTQETISPSHLAAARAIDHLRRQLGIVMRGYDGTLLGACPIEGLTPSLLASLQGRLSVLISAERAQSLGLSHEGKPVSFEAATLTLEIMRAISDPLATLTSWPNHLSATIAPHDTLIKLAKHAGLLPAMLLVEGGVLPEAWAQVSLAEIEEYWHSVPLDIEPLVTASLPIIGAENTTVICLRERYGTSVHLALVIGDISTQEAPLVRVHSSCVTGDILGSLRCDCGNQLHQAISLINAEGAGVLIYLHQEGRGIGIANKLRAYALQQQGHDTYQANHMLGFDDDDRDFSIALTILEKLAIRKIRLLTNNPQKISALEKSGLTIVARVPLIAGSNPHNADYIRAKSQKHGHWS
mgnify:CR=1 FL=1